MANRIHIAALGAFAFAAACATQDNIAMSDKTGDNGMVDRAPAAGPGEPEQAAMPSGPEGEDLLWLEEVEGERALSWVRAQNARSLSMLENDPHYEPFFEDALEVMTSDERIPYGSVRGGQVYNFWQDDENPRGLWRRTPLESYRSETPEWETVLDIDALSKAEDANWVFKGANCHAPEDGAGTVCMVSLSDGGKDAVIQREFDLATKQFVEGGFVTGEAKQGAEWVSGDTLLIATDWGGDGATLTESGYPSVVKRWTRGTPLESAETLFSGDRSDVGVWPMTLKMRDGRIVQGAVEADTFFTSSYWIFPQSGGDPVKLPIPAKSTLRGLFAGELLFSIEQDWVPDRMGLQFRSGDLLSFDLKAFLRTGKLPPVKMAFRPRDSQALESVAIAKNSALVAISDTVVSKLLQLEPIAGGWQLTPVDLPGKGAARITFSDPDEEEIFLNYEGFLTPDTLLEFTAVKGEAQVLKSLPAKFDTEGLSVKQHFATSSDGTEIPYFVVRREDVALDGSTPTILYGYGGFQISLNPSYSATTGRLWLAEGGAYVVANTRGGGEFGPEWHQAGLKTKRQTVYDDFIAVAEDLIGRGLTSPEKLGIMGRSNGGLLMGVMFNQRPDLWNAVDIGVPLLDMLRYHKLLAGASWVDEYGSPEVAEERAFLETISPVHNFDPDKDYPTPFFYTSTKDDRVHPGHARKLARQLENAGKPFYYYENIDGGHAGAAKPETMAKRVALEYTYFARRLMDGRE